MSKMYIGVSHSSRKKREIKIQIFWSNLRRMALIIMITMTPIPANLVIAIREEPFAMPPMDNVSASLDFVGNFVIHAWMDFTIILHVMHVTASLLDPVGLHVRKMANAVATITTLDTNVTKVH